MNLSGNQNSSGFTKDPQKLASVRLFRDAAVSDGWSIHPTYSHESILSASTLEKDGFLMMVLTRVNADGTVFEACINIWDKDSLHVAVPETYSMKAIVENSHVCEFCLKPLDVSYRVAFSNRACKACVAEAKQKLERPGWYN